MIAIMWIKLKSNILNVVKIEILNYCYHKSVTVL